MGQVVLDSSNLDAIVKDATGEGLKAPELPMNSGVQAQIDEAAKILKEVEAAAPIDPATDEVEGEDGLTPKEKRELTDKMQKAIAKRTRALREAEEFAAEQYNNRRLAEAKAQQLEKDLEAARVAAKPPEPPKEAVKPTREQFANEDAFRDALIDWSVEQRLKIQAEKDAKAAADKRQAEILATASARIAKALETVPDFKEVTEAVDLAVPPAIANYMQESDMFAELGYHLAKHPEELERIQGMHWTRQLVEIGKIESKLQPFSDLKSAKVPTDTNGSTEPSTNGAKPSTETGEVPSPRQSAPVIRPLSTGSATQVEKPASERDFKEELAYWQKKRNVNLTRRSRH